LNEDAHERDTASRLTYRDAGVDIDAGNRLVATIKSVVEDTHRPEVLGGLGGFGALFELPPEKYRHPVLVAGTDGVGTKLLLGLDRGRYYGLGIDLVAMCANDVLVHGAQPLFFLDYYATGKLDSVVAGEIVKGIADGCRQCGAALVGGETAELPDLYDHGHFDLAGFCVGAVEKQDLIDGSRVQPGDTVIGLAASGPHANGYSLIRRVLEISAAGLDSPCGETTLGEALMAPTRIYAGAVLDTLAAYPVHALAHITGGGLPENIPRVLPAGCAVHLETSAWPWPPVFDWLQQAGGIAEAEMLRTFNCGVGMVLIVPEKSAATVAAHISRGHAVGAWRIGKVTAHGGNQPRVVFD
jgi:phosphoribosylformylglycinamidine cyclo-ligase